MQHLLLRAVYYHGLAAQPRIDRIRLKEIGGGNRKVCVSLSAGEELLRKRRALFWRMDLGSDHHNAAVPAAGAQRFRSTTARFARADDNDRVGAHPRSASLP